LEANECFGADDAKEFSFTAREYIPHTPASTGTHAAPGIFARTHDAEVCG